MPEIVGLPLKHVEAVLAQTFGISEPRRKTFLGRLQQLQKLGLPQGTNVGRSAKASYAGWHVAELSFYLDLLDAGVTPAALVSHFSQSPFYPTLQMTGYSSAVERAADSEPALVGLYLATLDHLRGDGAVGSHEIVLATDPAVLVSTFREHPGIVLNITRRVRSLKQVIGSLFPELKDHALLPEPILAEQRELPGGGAGEEIIVGHR